MAKHKTYTTKDNADHVLIKLLTRKGYADVVINYGPALSRSRGYKLIEPLYKDLGWDIKVAKNRINQLPDIKPVES